VHSGGPISTVGIDLAEFSFIDSNSARSQQPKKNPCHYLQKESLPFCNAGGNLQLDPEFRGRPNTQVQLFSFSFPRSTFPAGAPAWVGVQTIEKGVPRQYKTYEKTAHQ